MNHKYKGNNSHSARLDIRSTNEERNSHVELERERLALDEAELAEVVPVVGRVHDVRVVQLAERLQLLVDLQAAEGIGVSDGGLRSSLGRIFVWGPF
jgi:hypothetical protein